MSAESSLKRRLAEALGVPFTTATDVRPLRNGTEIFPAMLGAIASAERSIEFETFIYWSGDIAERMCDALVDAADRGVLVRVLLDGVGSLPMPGPLLERLRDSRVELRRFRQPGLLRLRSIDQRTHRKILVCDARVAFTGGVGIAEEWEGDARSPSEWRETHFRMTGSVARILRGAFYANWELAPPASAFHGGAGATDADAPVDETPERSIDVQVIQSFGGRPEGPPAQALQHLVFAFAEERVRAMTPYFVPSEALVDEIVQASQRGVEVELLVPGPHIDHRLSLLAGQDLWTHLLNAGVTIHQYQPTFPHAKVVTVDGILSTVGSMNLNRRSARKDDEIVLNIVDREVTAALDADFDRDLESSVRVDRDSDWPRRGTMQRAAEWWTRRVLGAEL